MLSMTFQENPLFTASFRDNITYGHTQATAREIATAVERAGLADFLESLPNGLNTQLGEKGAKLSMGQAQRIGLARALLRDGQILRLDEPTSALDADTEELVIQGVRAWVDEAPARLAIILTHRRTTAEQADRIYHIAGGKVVEVEDIVTPVKFKINGPRKQVTPDESDGGPPSRGL